MNLELQSVKDHQSCVPESAPFGIDDSQAVEAAFAEVKPSATSPARPLDQQVISEVVQDQLVNVFDELARLAGMVEQQKAELENVRSNSKASTIRPSEAGLKLSGHAENLEMLSSRVEALTDQCGQW